MVLSSSSGDLSNPIHDTWVILVRIHDQGIQQQVARRKPDAPNRHKHFKQRLTETLVSLYQQSIADFHFLRSRRSWQWGVSRVAPDSPPVHFSITDFINFSLTDFPPRHRPRASRFFFHPLPHCLVHVCWASQYADQVFSLFF